MNETAQPDMDSPKREGMKGAKALLEAARTASLAVLDIKDRGPFTTLVNIAVDSGLRPVILVSTLSHHTRCLIADPRASILVHGDLPSEGDRLTGPRVTLNGVFSPCKEQAAVDAFLARHPYSDLYVNFGDFGFWRMEPERVHIVAGFGRAYKTRFLDLADI